MSELASLADDLLQACKRREILVAAAESCTGGMVMALLTDIPGSSGMVDRGFVTYSNEAKVDMVGVRKETLDKFGAVSEETAHEMAAGALKNSRAGIAISITGIAGPDGGSDEKPVGLVWFGVAVANKPVLTQKRLFDDRGRDYVRRQSVGTALELALAALK